MTTKTPKNGIHTEYYLNDQKKSEGNYKDGKLDGKCTEWHDNGQMSFKGNYKNDKRNK